MGGGGGDKCATVGYRYYVGLHLVFCHFVDALKQIGVGEKVAWSGTATSNTTIYIYQPELFGGESREGGVVGNVDLCFGAPTQTKNAYLQSRLGASIPAFRGLFALVANKCMVASNNPYIKGWWILATRSKIGWRDDLADIAGADGYVDMNPVHIIREALVNTTWGGLGYPVSDLDDASFQTAASLIKAEGVGISIVWARNTSVDDFISLILRHINAVVFFSHATGLLTIKLVRDESGSALNTVLNESNVIELSDYSIPSSTEIVNQVTVKYVDRENNVKTVTVQDIAGIERMSGQINEKVVEFVGFTNGYTASAAASRELLSSCLPISSLTLTVNRNASALEPGSCFIFDWAPLGISGMVMRVVSVDIGDHTDNKITIKAIRDVFSFNSVSFSTPSNSLWVSPYSPPADALNRKISEITWWQFVREYMGDSSAVLAELDDTSTFVTSVCTKPSQDAFNYEMWTKNQGATTWERRDTDSFPYAGTLLTSVVPEVTSVLQLTESYIDTDLVFVGMYAYLENEIVAVTAIDNTNRTVTVNRGVLDTIPVSHAEGSVIIFSQGMFGIDSIERVVGEAVDVKLLPATSLGRLGIAYATNNAYTCTGRMMRPYPPGNVKVNTVRWPSSIGTNAQFDITWSHRDRLTQTVTLNKQDETDIGPEEGTTYTLRLYGETGVLKKTVTGITGTSYSWTTEVADSGLGRLNTSVKFELESVRDGLTSYNKWSMTIPRL